MKERILKVLKSNPKGMRKRDIAGELGVWVCNLAAPMAELESRGLVKKVYHSDPAQMEFYDIYFAAD